MKINQKIQSVGIGIVIVLIVIALFTPLIAGNKPLLQISDHHWSFPAFGDLIPKSTTELPKPLSKNDFYINPLIPYSPTEYNLDDTLLPPSAKHWLGTDEQGRDVASRILYGSRVSLSVGIIAVGLSVLVGVFIGALAGFYGGKIDLLISRFIEIVICFPTFFLILAVIASVGPGLTNIMIVIGLTGWTDIARLVRGEFLKLREQEFATAVVTLGAKPWRVILKHLLPNALLPVVISATFGIAGAILSESGLSYLGFGVQPPTPSWGDILSQSRDFMDIAWWLTLFPGIAIFLTVTGFNLVGERLRDQLDPKGNPTR